MTIVTALITHLDADRAARQLAYLRALAPQSRFVLCHGGRREEFERIAEPGALFVEDPSLRGPNKDQSYNQVLAAVYESCVRNDPAVELVYFIEYDHLILSGGFEDELRALAARSPAGLFGKYASERSDSNWAHLTRYRGDEQLARFFRRISRREDHSRRWGCLGTGMLFRRAALEAFCSVEDAPHAYLELFIPTVVHHLGFGVADVDALGGLYAGIRWRPPFSVEEAIAAKAAGRAFLHPFKELEALERLGQAPERASPAKSSAAGSASG
jgi:hypothetical protein